MALNQALQYKNIPNHLRIKNFDSSFLHHEICKLTLMSLLKRNNPKAEVILLQIFGSKLTGEKE